MGESSLFLILSVFVPPLVWGTRQVTTQTPISGNRTPSPLLPEIGSLKHSQLLISHSTYNDLPSSFSCARCVFSCSFFPPRATFHFRSDDFRPVILRCPLSGSPCLRPPPRWSPSAGWQPGSSWRMSWWMLQIIPAQTTGPSQPG